MPALENQSSDYLLKQKLAGNSLQGLDGFWRWVLDQLHAGAPDLFPGTGLPSDASGFEEAFSEVQLSALHAHVGLLHSEP